jgi:nucleoside-diphosphate-sugar epimerase
MKVALTGATGFIGSHVLTELQQHGHEVTALVRGDTQADIVGARGARAAVVDLYDRPAVASLLSKVDGAIHTASPGDATTAAKARAELGWHPSHPSLADEFRHGSYRK